MPFPFKCLGLVFSFSIVSTLAYTQEREQDSTRQALHEIVIVRQDPIAEKFSSSKMNRLDIYFNPASSGDPLKAINLLPMSTSSAETANPVLRGGLADQSKVYLNGAPIVNPVRNTQDNGLGNFSIFNAEMLDKQYVYASNPPLNYGNATAGIVEIETTKQLEEDSYQVALGLSNLGIQVHKKLGKTAFVQYYANLQFSGALQAINPNSLKDLHRFESKDMGVHFRTNLTKNTSFTSYSYYIDEGYESQNYRLQYTGAAVAKQKRFFTIQSLEYAQTHSIVKLTALVDQSATAYTFATIDAKSNATQYFLTASHKYKLAYGWQVQYGVDFSTTQYENREQRPQFFYAMHPQHPVVYDKTTKQFTYTEAYGYTEYKFANDLGVSLGMRKSIFAPSGSFDFLSTQGAAFYKMNPQHRFIFGMGNYNSYSTPNYFNTTVSLFNSKQIALDYYYENIQTTITGAVYYKKDRGHLALSALEELAQRHLIGTEWSYTHYFGRYFSFVASNTLLHQTEYINKSPHQRWMYFFKTQWTYNHPKYFTASLVGTTHPGSSYMPVKTAIWDTEQSVFIPVVEPNTVAHLNSYFRVDFTINKIVPIRRSYVVVYASIINVLNRKNEQKSYYSADYTHVYFQNFQRRVFYFGLQFKF